MKYLVDYFEPIPALHRSLILVGGITLFGLVESAVPLFQFAQATPSYQKLHHTGINVFFTLMTIIVNFGLSFFLLRTRS